MILSRLASSLLSFTTVFCPKRLPETARKLGQYYAKFRRAAENFKRQLLDMDTEFTRAAEGVANEVQKSVEIPEERS